jgi:Transposase DDE domain group 1
MAPSTLGTFMRSFTFGHVRQLDRVLAESIERAWSAGAGPGSERLVIDVDSFIGEVHGYQKQGAGFGYTGERGYHPLLATRSGTGEALHVRLRKGASGSGRGALRFVQELIARVGRAGASGEMLVRADSAFWNRKVIAYLARRGCRYSIGVTMHKLVLERIAKIPEQAWEPVEDYPDTGICQLAETSLGDERLIVRARPPAGPGGADRAVCLLAPLRLRHQPRRRPAHRRPRAPPARRVRARDPRPKRPGARPLPLGQLRRQLRLDSDRLPRPQPPALDRPARARRPHPTRGADDPPLAASAPRPPHPHGQRWTLHLPAAGPGSAASSRR